MNGPNTGETRVVDLEPTASPWISFAIGALTGISEGQDVDWRTASSVMQKLDRNGTNPSLTIAEVNFCRTALGVLVDQSIRRGEADKVGYLEALKGRLEKVFGETGG